MQEFATQHLRILLICTIASRAYFSPSIILCKLQFFGLEKSDEKIIDTEKIITAT